MILSGESHFEDHESKAQGAAKAAAPDHASVDHTSVDDTSGDETSGDQSHAGGSGDADDAGTALAASGAASQDDSAIAPLLFAAGERMDPPAGPRPLFSTLLDYSAHAAMIVGLLGFAWTISDHVGKTPSDQAAVIPAPVAPAPDQTAALRASTQKMASDIAALRASLDALRVTMRQDKTNDQIRALAANVDGVKSGLNATKTETTAALAQLSGKIDHLPHSEAAARIQQIVDRLDKMERQTADMTTTASLGATATAKAVPVALPPVKPQSAVKAAAPSEAETLKKLPVLADWVVRDVYDGVAVVEGRRGPMEVVPGVTIPGAGVVKSIERHGVGWTVTTSKGQLAYAPPPRDRAPRDYYRPGPEDF